MYWNIEPLKSRMHTNNANTSRNQKQQRQRFSKTVSNLSLGSSILLMFRIVICAECGKTQLCCRNFRHNKAVLVCLFYVILPSTSNVNPFFITSHLTNTHTTPFSSDEIQYEATHLACHTHICLLFTPLKCVLIFDFVGYSFGFGMLEIRKHNRIISISWLPK